MAQAVLAALSFPAAAPQAMLGKSARFWAREDGFRHACYISAGLFVTLALLKLVSA